MTEYEQVHCHTFYCSRNLPSSNVIRFQLLLLGESSWMWEGAMTKC